MQKTNSTATMSELKRSEARYRSLFENMLEGFAFCKMLFDEKGEPVDFVYLEVNRAFERLTGLKNAAGKKVSDLIPEIRTTNPELFEIYGTVARTGKPQKFETYVKELKIWFSISVYSYEQGTFVAVFDNITARKKMFEELQERNRELELMNVAMIDRETKMIELKEQIKKMRDNEKL